MTRYLRIVIALVTLIALGLFPSYPHPADAGPRPLVTMTPEREDATEIDLAAVALRPSDVPNNGFVQDTSRMLTSDEQAATLSSTHGGRVDAWTAALTEARLRHSYEHDLVALSSEDDTALERTIHLSMLEFADTEGARQVFDLLTDASISNESDVVIEARSFGDQSVVLCSEMSSGAVGTPYQQIEAIVRLDNVVAMIAVRTIDRRSGDLALVESLTETLLHRIATTRVEGAPDLGALIVRLGGFDVTTTIDRYNRSDGKTRGPFRSDDDALFLSGEVPPEPTDRYIVRQEIETGAEIGGGATYLVRLERYPDAATASRRIEAIRRQPRIGAESFGALEPTRPTKLVGEEQATFFVHSRGDTLPAGDRMVVRIENMVIDSALFNSGETLVLLQEYVLAQTTCLFGSACLERTPSMLSERPAQDGTVHVINQKSDLTDAMIVAARTGEQPGRGPVEAPKERWRLRGNLVSPALTLRDGQIFVIDNDDGSVQALDAGTGITIWRTLLDAPATASPAIDSDTVYIGIEAGVLLALDATTGTERWRYFGDELDFFSSPAIVDGVVFVASAIGTVVALDARNGAEIWQFDSDSGIYSEVAVADNMVAVGTTDGVLFVLDATDGQEYWRVQTSEPILGTPAVSGGFVYVATYPGARGDGALLAFDAVSGQERWRFAGVSAITFVVFGGMAFVAEREGDLIGMASTTGAIRWRQPSEARGWSAPIVASGVLYAATARTLDTDRVPNTLFAMDPATGGAFWWFGALGDVGAPVIGGGMVFIVSRTASLYGPSDDMVLLGLQGDGI